MVIGKTSQHHFRKEIVIGKISSCYFQGEKVIGKISPYVFFEEIRIGKISHYLIRREMPMGKISHPVFFGPMQLRQMRTWMIRSDGSLLLNIRYEKSAKPLDQGWNPPNFRCKA